MNTLVKAGNGNAVAVSGNDPFTEFGNTVSPKNIYGTLLKFAKGDWLAGEGQIEVKVGTKFIAVMDKAAAGYVRWENKRPTDQVMSEIISGGSPRRSDCGDLDKEAWPFDDKGQQKDPWQRTVYLPLIDAATGDVYTFAASSKGGITAVGKLSIVYGQHRQKQSDQYPVIALSVDSYVHDDFGRIKVPVFEVKGHVSNKAKYEARLVAGADAGPSEKYTEANPPLSRGEAEFEDEIPF